MPKISICPKCDGDRFFVFSNGKEVICIKCHKRMTIEYLQEQ